MVARDGGDKGFFRVRVDRVGPDDGWGGGQDYAASEGPGVGA